MTSDTPQRDVRRSFEEELTQLRRQAVQIGGLVLENTRRATEAFLEGRLDLADRVVAADDEIDRRYVEAEQAIFETIARQQPVAGDLRLLVALTRILYDLERSGDLAVNCANATKWLHGVEVTPDLRGPLSRLMTEAASIFAQALDVLADLDAERGRRLDAEDEIVDDLLGEFYRTLIPMAEKQGFEQAMALSRVGRYLERIADHGVNVGEHVSFIVEGEFPERLPD